MVASEGRGSALADVAQPDRVGQDASTLHATLLNPLAKGLRDGLTGDPAVAPVAGVDDSREAVLAGVDVDGDIGTAVIDGILQPERHPLRIAALDDDLQRDRHGAALGTTPTLRGGVRGGGLRGVRLAHDLLQLRGNPALRFGRDPCRVSGVFYAAQA